MSQRKIKDAKDLESNELIYFKGHAKATYISDGTNVEDALTKKQDEIKDLDTIRLNASRTIPSKTSELTNDSGFLTEHQDISNLATKQELASIDEKAEQAITDASIAKNAVASLEGLSDATTAMETLAGQVVQIEENKQKLSELGSKTQDVIHPIYSGGYINIDTKSVSGSYVVTISSRMRVRISKNPYYINIPEGNYTIKNPTVAFYSLVFDTEINSLLFVDARYVKDSQIIIIAIKNDGRGIEVNSFISDVRVNGVSQSSRIQDIEDDVHKLTFLSKNRYVPVVSRGYIDIDTVNNTVSSNNIIYYLNSEGNISSIPVRTDTFDNSTSYNILAVVFNNETSAFEILPLYSLLDNHLLLASVTRNYNIINHVSGSSIEVRINGISERTRLSNVEESLKDFNDSNSIPSVIAAAGAYESFNKTREQLLRDLFKSSGDIEHWYGAEWQEVEDSDNVISINSDGDEHLHVLLPIHSKMRRCVIKDRVVNYYLDEDNSELKSDGTSANLNGADGDVMVEIPEFFFRVEESTDKGVRTIRIKLSEQGLDGFVYSPKHYTSAYEATINRTTNRIASVCTTLFDRSIGSVNTISESKYVEGSGYTRNGVNIASRSGFTNNAINYRGGTNDSSLDNETDTSSQNYSRNMLGLPASNLNRTQCREMSDVANGYLSYLYDTAKILWILFTTEYKTRHSQNTELGMGATVYPDYNAYEAYWSPQGGGACLPCGITNSLGNKSGVVYYKMINVPVASTGSKETIEYTQWGNVWMPCMSYRGVEHFWGHLYDIIDQINIVIGPTTRYEEGNEGNGYYSYNNVYYYYQNNPFLTNNSTEDKYLLGVYEYMPNTNTITSLLMGTQGHILPIKSARPSDYNKNYADCVELLRTSSDEAQYIAMNGRLVSATFCGANFPCSTSFADSSKAVEGTRSYSRSSDGTRLDIIL